MTRVVITGMGVVSPLGHSAGALFSRLLEGACAIREQPDLRAAGYRVWRAARVSDFVCDPARRGRALGLCAAEQAMRGAGIETAPDAAVFIGSTLGESYAFERAAELASQPELGECGVAAFGEAIRARYGVQSAVHAVATACAAGNDALGAALYALREDRAPLAIAGGVEPFSRLALVGFSRSRAMAADGCKPFDKARSGMSLGEGAAVFVLERAERALAQGAQPLAELVSIGQSCDAHHPTAPEPEGRGMHSAMRQALADAGIEPRAIDWVNVHGSGTRVSDAAEAKALQRLFGAELPHASGSKGALGHGLGAASALEAAICVEGLRTQTVPPTVGHDAPDPDCIACTRTPTRARLRYVLNNAFAFGGLNSALLLRAWPS
jgi:3-oxoacyl-[acyl-carrier-protein] synthase II